ncbi:spore germination protein [Ferviditalea candida]|uniref:Spore germination protein n=1 Tax=Ferviditalea candida TaxID=3108399 RepID=A0ABU5ZJZ7_9BACL|nr:spore germination protein [Paenibacillaceae bacterium T2]
MFNWIKRKIKFTQMKNKQLDIPDHPVSSKLQDNIDYLKQLFENSSDIVFRSFSVGKRQEIDAFLVAIDGMYDKTPIHENVIKPLMNIDFQSINQIQMVTYFEKSLISIFSLKQEHSIENGIAHLMKGDVLLFIDGLKKVYVLGTRAWEMRSIEEPITETTIRGPREGFVETLRTNTSMLRRKLGHPKLQIQQMVLGRMSQTEIAVAYIEGIAPPEILQEVKRRLISIEMDNVLESGILEEFIEDAPFSPFPTVANTERPDVAAARLLEGRVAILIDGSPMALIVPHLLFESFQSSEDYYSRPYYSSFLRMLRLFGFLVTTLAPATYTALQDYHKEMFPAELLVSVASSREGVPLPLVLELLLMLIVFEWLREAVIRMPRPVGQTVSIVGALVLGESAVNAGIVGAPTIIVVAVSAITGFLVTALSDVAAVLRFFYLIVGSIFGVYGIMLVICATLLHLASLRSFGIPYMAPLMPITWSDWKDFFIRAPMWALNRRPEALRVTDEIRQSDGMQPQPPVKKSKRKN